MIKSLLSIITLTTLFASLSADSTFNVLDYYPNCDNNIRIGVCRNYIIYGLVDAASMFYCINNHITGGDYLSVQNQINLAQDEVRI